MRYTSGLPDLSQRLCAQRPGELYFSDSGYGLEGSGELSRVLEQGNPAWLDLQMPGLATVVRICFPAQRHVRIYTKGLGGETLGELVAAHKPDYCASELPTDTVEYRYGMSMCPWMFHGDLDWGKSEKERQIRADALRDGTIVNYVIHNNGHGADGVLIRCFITGDGPDRNKPASRRMDEWMEIYAFSTGNFYKFVEEWRANPRTRLLARFVPTDETNCPRWRLDSVTAAVP